MRNERDAAYQQLWYYAKRARMGIKVCYGDDSSQYEMAGGTRLPHFYINSQEFFVWSLIAVVYTLGLISARFKRRWRRKLFENGYEEELYEGEEATSSIFRSDLHKAMFARDFGLTLLVTFPVALLYIRARQTVTYPQSPFSLDIAVGAAITFCLPMTFFIMLVSSLFYRALSLFAGD